jgi:hypothetical protein
VVFPPTLPAPEVVLDAPPAPMVIVAVDAMLDRVKI